MFDFNKCTDSHTLSFECSEKQLEKWEEPPWMDGAMKSIGNWVIKDVYVCLTGCERLTWEVAEPCWSNSTANSQPWATSVHTMEHRWSKVSNIFYCDFCNMFQKTLLKMFLFSRCTVKGTRALSVARSLFQHCDRRHRGLPGSGQPADLPGDNQLLATSPRRAVFQHIPLPYRFSECLQKVYTWLMSVCSRSELRRTEWSFAQTSR